MENVEGQGAAEQSRTPSRKDDEVEAGPSPAAIEARMERLLRMLLWVGDAPVARSLRGIPGADLNLQPLTIRTALQTLRKKRDPTTYLTQSQYRPTIPLVAEVVSETCQDAIVAALGDAADHPDRSQLLTALEEVQERFPVSTVALTLSYVSVTDMEAADLCDDLLETEERFQVPASVHSDGQKGH